MLAVPKKTLKDSWAVIDVLVVAFFWVEALSSDLPFPPTLIRLARMARLLRFLRVVKTIRGFASLYLMLQSIKGSVSALGWSSVVLILGEMMLALALNLVLSDYWEDEQYDLDKREALYDYYGTFTKSLMTMVEMLLGNWYSITRVLIYFNELFMLFGICHQLVLGFAVIEVISGVFLNETFKVANLDDSIMLNEVRRAAKAEKTKLTEFFLKADKDGSGQVDQDELKTVLDNKQVGEWLSAMGLDLSDIDKVFNMLDTDGDGQLSCQELVDGAALLKKPARAVDLQAVQKMLQDLSIRLSAKQW
jgi:Ca2+-binding EF-hand superfamily protein